MNIYESIAAVQADVDFIGKEKETQSGSRFKYRGVDQVLNTLHPLFAKHKVFAVPEVIEVLGREWRKTEKGGNVVYQTIKVKYTFYAEDGSNVSAVVIGEAMDSGDKASNKCMSVAYKYACFQILSIPTEETTADPDERDDELPPKQEFITPEVLAAFGVSKDKIESTVNFFEKHVGKPVALFDDDDLARCWVTLEKWKAEGRL